MICSINSKEICAHELRLANIFTDNMVLQRDKQISIWGWYNPGEELFLQIKDNTYHTIVESDSSWKIDLKPNKAGGPFNVLIYSEFDSLSIKNVLFGDVWICSGQSNMQYKIEKFNYSISELGKTNDSLFRYFAVPNNTSFKQEADITEGKWVISDLNSINQFSAIGYYFGQQLREHTDIPIGILDISWGGSTIEAWMEPKLFTKGDLSEYHVNQLKTDSISLRDKILINEYDNAKIDSEWFDPNYNTNDWLTHDVPQKWEDAGYEYLDGILFYRKIFKIEKLPNSKEVNLSLSTIDDSDETWLNGKKIGKTSNDKFLNRQYFFRTSILKKGLNVLLVKVEDFGGGGGLRGKVNEMYLELGSRRINLSGCWHFKVGKFIFKRGPDKHYSSLIYNTMIHPLLNFRVKGIVWYQGENNAIDPQRAYKYRFQFPKLISTWRHNLREETLPFIYVQLPNFRKVSKFPEESNWAVLRESQQSVLNLENTAEIVTIDIGEADNIHPRNKKEVGLRLSLVARNLAYGENVVFNSPRYDKHELKGSKIIISFNHVANGLKSNSVNIRGFAISENNLKFEWAKARIIDNNKVEIWSEKITNPKYIRYGWADNPGILDLYNSANLPVSPFRTL